MQEIVNQINHILANMKDAKDFYGLNVKTDEYAHGRFDELQATIRTLESLKDYVNHIKERKTL